MTARQNNTPDAAAPGVVNSRRRGAAVSGDPRPVTRDDVRRVLVNWPEYGGAVPNKKAKDRPAYADDVDKVRLHEERAVFPLDLLRAVGQRRKARSRQPADSGVNRKARAYPLSGLVYCAHCEKLARAQNDPRLRTRFTGTTKVWETASDEEKKDMAQHPFAGLLYNIDTRRFEGFSLKPWADRFLLIRMGLYYQMFGDLEGVKENSTPVLGEWNPVPHRGLRGTIRSNPGKTYIRRHRVYPQAAPRPTLAA